MTTETIVAGLATAVAALSLFYTARAANAAKNQTRLQHAMRRAAAEPYIWVDMRPDQARAGLFILVVGNSGPTVATSVRVTFAPELDINSKGWSAQAVDALRRGLPSLAPGMSWRWSLGRGSDILAEDQQPSHIVTIEADGPFGPLDSVSYTIGLQEIRHTLDVPAGSLHGVSTAVKKLDVTLSNISSKLDRED